jgi:hypothetical protein
MRMLDGEGVGGERVGIHMRLLLLGSTRADLINFSSTLGALRRSVAYAQIVTPLLYGSGYSLDNFKKNRGGVVNCMTYCIEEIPLCF